MPEVIRFLRKSTGEPVGFVAIDDEMRLAFGEPASPAGEGGEWLYNWYNSIGYALAIASRFGKGKPMEEVTEQYKDSELGTKVMKFLNDNYTFNSWREYKP